MQRNGDALVTELLQAIDDFQRKAGRSIMLPWSREEWPRVLELAERVRIAMPGEGDGPEYEMEGWRDA